MWYQEAEVSGFGAFPIDMLRYDGCFPADTHAVQTIASARGTSWTIRMGRHSRSASETWTVDRWRSFGCKLTRMTGRKV